MNEKIIDCHKAHIEVWNYQINNIDECRCRAPIFQTVNPSALSGYCFPCHVAHIRMEKIYPRHTYGSQSDLLEMRTDIEDYYCNFCPIVNTILPCTNKTIGNIFDRIQNISDNNYDHDERKKYAQIIRDAEWIGRKMYPVEMI